jgi:hypothetical protein
VVEADLMSCLNPGSCRIPGGESSDIDCEYDPEDDPEFDIIIFKSPYVNNVVTTSISYPSGHEGEAFNDSWYTYGLFYRFPQLLEDYSEAEDFYSALDTTKLADLYSVFYELNNLYSYVEDEREILIGLIDSIHNQEVIIMQTQDSINFGIVSSKNDSLIHVVDSLNTCIITLTNSADSLRDSIEVGKIEKLSEITSMLGSISPADSIHIKLKQEQLMIP